MLSQTSLKIIVLATLLFIVTSSDFLIKKEDDGNDGYKLATFTAYWSYADCCKDLPNYDPKANTDECTDFSACKYSGGFAAIGHKSIDWLKKNSVIAFYDNSDPDGKNFLTKYGGKTIHLRKNGITFDAIIADTCGNDDCNGCCSKAKHGILVDMEYWTVIQNLGSLDKVDGGDIEYKIDY